MLHPVAYDVTHLKHRLFFSAPSGIEKVDLFFAEHFSQHPELLCANVHYGLGAPIVFGPHYVKKITACAHRRWNEDISIDQDSQYQRLRAWLLNGTQHAPRENKKETGLSNTKANVLSFARTAAFSSIRIGGPNIPKGATYLNVAQFALEHDFYFRWLAARKDLQKVFFIHDLLPLDYPEFWPPEHELRFQKRIARVIEHATAFITASIYVRDRLYAELIRRGYPKVPVFTQALPPPNKIAPAGQAVDPSLADADYFVAVGTIEPRKNHQMLLNVWRALIDLGRPVPKLVFIGKRGWGSEPVIQQIAQPDDIGACVGEVSGLSAAAMRELLRHAKGALIPSRAEGFGLPLVEALAAGTPVIASDIPAFREVSAGCAILRDPFDNAGWRDAIVLLAYGDRPAGNTRAAIGVSFKPVAEQTYFEKLGDFMDAL